MRGLHAAVAVLVVLLLAGCSAIPMTGVVKPGTTEAPNGTQLVYVPNGPTSGASPQEIVSGFLTAASGGGRFTIAKEYLTPGFAKKWDPSTGVLVQETQAVLSGTGADVRAEIPISATVNAAGVYAPAAGVRTRPFHLVQQRGQWRIDSALNGIVLTQPVFQQNYAPRLLQFFDQTWTRLVPDRRWFPAARNDGESDVRNVVAALIEGPHGPLSGQGVTTNALDGARIAAISSSDGDVTTVTLTTRGASNPTVSARMQQQLVQTLGTPVRLVVNDLVVPQVKPLTDQLTPEAYVLADDQFGTLSPTGSFTADRTLGPKIAATRPTAVTVSLRQKLAAIQTRSGEVAIVTTSGSKIVDRRSGLVAPTLDQRGWVYSASSSGTLQASNGKDPAVTLSADLGEGTVTAIQASPDGTRLLVLTESTAGPRGFIAAIERDTAGVPIGLTNGQYSVQLGTTLGSSGGGATWIDDDDVAVLTNGSDSDQISTQQLGGISGALDQFANVTTIVGTTSSDDLRLLVSSGIVYVWNDSSWQQQSDSAPSISVLAVQR